MNLAQAEQAFISQLTPLYEAAESKSIFMLSIGHYFGWDKTYFLLNKNSNLGIVEWEQLEAILAELKTAKPIQYILGETTFYGIPFKVNPSVLIPRPETEELVQWILVELKAVGPAPKILDIGTGSGCIPISLQKFMPNARVFALDISAEALQTARENASINGVNIHFIQQDVLNCPDDLFHDQLDLVVSNPPYVCLSEAAQMRSNVLEHEPHLALFVTDNDPLVFYRAIADFALRHLKSGGLLFFEINEHLGVETVNLLQEKGFVDVLLKQDLPGKDRMVKAVKPS